jgi:hypothetical protein
MCIGVDAILLGLPKENKLRKKGSIMLPSKKLIFYFKMFESSKLCG